MKVLYDHQIFSSQKYGGISRYFFELIKQLDAMDNVSYDLPLKYSNNFYLLNNPDLFHVQRDEKTDKFFYGMDFKGKAKIHRFLGRMSIVEHPMISNLNTSVRRLKESDFDIFHPSYYDDYFIKYLNKKPFVLTIYDMIHEIYVAKHFKKSNKLILRKRELINKASHIIAISENTKKDIIEIYNIDEKKISVIYLGNSLNYNRSKVMDLPVPDNYILYVGDRHAYKNFEFFIRSIQLLLLADKKLFLVCAGSVNFTVKEKSLISGLGLTEKVIHLPLIDDAILMNLYNKALCFVFPTLYEGFGIPVLEAFACGSPALLSNTSSLPEVGGDAALYFDPEDAGSIFDAVKKVVYDRELADSLRKKGYKQLQNFSWEKCAVETKKVYEKVLKNS